MRRLPRLKRFWRGAIVLAASGALLLGTTGPGVAAGDGQTPPPFSFSTFAAIGKHQVIASTPARGSARYGAAAQSEASLSVGTNVDVIGTSDVVQQATVDGVTVNTCNPGMRTAQNETPFAANPANPSDLVGGANDYRLYEPSENRYDGSGGFYVSADSGKTWTVGLLPGLVKANAVTPGPYESAGDPSISAGPNDTFWYANLAFNRSDDANSVAASRSTDGGQTWTTYFVYQTSAQAGATLFNDKEWIAADPSDSSGQSAYATWTQFHSSPNGHTTSSIIVISRTTDGGKTWTAPTPISSYKHSQGSVVQVDQQGRVYVTFETYAQGRDAVAFSFSDNHGQTFQTKLLAVDNDIPSPLPGATFRTNSFPSFALDGQTLHVVWANWNGANADVVYMRSDDRGATWTLPVTIGGGAGDQFFPWVGAVNGQVFASWLNRAGSDDTYTVQAAGSNDGGVQWTTPVAVSSASSMVASGNEFGYPNCSPDFIGDYTGMAVGSDGVAHPYWTDIRIGNNSPSTADQDPYTAPLTIK